MAVSRELVWLINQIRNAPSPRERLRLLALGWRTLRGLSTADRLAVARELGFDGAERLVEQLAKRGGASPSLLLRALESVASADPEQVSDLVRGLTESNRRVDSAERLVDVAADWLSEEAATAQATEQVEPDEGEPPGSEAPVAELQPPPLPPPPEVVEGELRTDIQPEEEPHVEEIEVGEEETADEERADPTVEEVKAAKPPSAAQRGGEPWVPVVEPPRVPQEEESVASPAADAESVIAKLAAVASLTPRFRVLAEVVDDLEGASAHQLGTVISIFPPGWARRRAIEVLLRAGLPREIGTVLELISMLERSSERMWALSTLATSRELADEERNAVIAAASSPSIRRRLRLRLSL